MSDPIGRGADAAPDRPAPGTVLITRPEPDGAAFAEALRRAAPGPWRAVLSPLGRIAWGPPPDPPEGADLVLTSRNALRALRGDGAGRRAWCVGPGTARAAREAGLEVAGWAPDAEALLETLLAERPEALFHARGEPARIDLSGRLRAAGLRVDEAVAYRQEAVAPSEEALSALRRGGVLAPVFSPLGAARLSRAAAGAAPGLRVVALGPAVAEAVEIEGARTSLCARPDAAAMLDALAGLLSVDGAG